MAGNSTVAALTAASTLDGSELLYSVQSGNDRKATATQMKTWTSASPTLVTPVLGIATGTSLAIGAQIWSGTLSTALTTLTGAIDGFRSSAANVTQFGAENTTASSSTQGGFVGMYSNDGAAMASGDRLGGLRVGGSSSASAIRNSALIAGFAAENWVDASAYGSRIEFQTTAKTTTTLATKLILGDAGVLSFGATVANTVPALKPSSTTLACRLGDDSADAPFSASTITAVTSFIAQRSTSSSQLQVLQFGDTLGGAVTDNVVVGNAGGGDLIFSAGAAERARIASGSFVVGTAAIATNASDGFLYIPTCAGTPTGTPTGRTGRIAMIYDTNNHQFWFYDGGWKQPKTPAAAAIITWQ